MIEYFNNSDQPEEDKINMSFQILSATRDAVTLALKADQPITYEKSLSYLADIAPDLHAAISKYIPDKNKSDLVKRFIEKGEALKTSPETLINEEIVEYSKAIKNSDQNTGALKSYVYQLNSALQYFEKRELSEHKLLEHDFYIASRSDFKEINSTAYRKDYKLPSGRRLRIYLAHPEKIETVLGADLIYEQYDLNLRLARFAHLQYKAWDTKALYLTERDKRQLQRLHDNLCKCNYCDKPTAYASANEFRFPYCSAFLRPTSRLLSLRSKMRSTGDHIPLCHALRINALEGKLPKDKLAECAISHKIFEEAFTKYHVGFGWIPIGELEEFYKKRNLNELAGNVRIIAQEISFSNLESDAKDF